VSSEHEQRVSPEQLHTLLTGEWPSGPQRREWLPDGHAVALDLDACRAALAESQERERALWEDLKRRQQTNLALVDSLKDMENQKDVIQQQHDALRAEMDRFDGGPIVAEHFARVVTERNAALSREASLRRQVGEWVPVVAGLHDEALRRHEAHAPTGGRCAICACLAASHDVFAAMEREAASGEPKP
jgi:hypothetical protein